MARVLLLLQRMTLIVKQVVLLCAVFVSFGVFAQNNDPPKTKEQLAKERLMMRSVQASVDRVTIKTIDSAFDFSELWPKSAQVLFVGEHHDVPEIQALVKKLLIEFASQNLVTDYASEFFETGDQTVIDLFYAGTPLEQCVFRRTNGMGYKDYYLDILVAAKDVGLATTALDYVTPCVSSQSHTRHIWATSPEGMERRNRSFLSQLFRIIAKHPEARVVAHMGTAHVAGVLPGLQREGVGVRKMYLVDRVNSSFLGGSYHYGLRLSKADTRLVQKADYRYPIAVIGKSTTVIIVPSEAPCRVDGVIRPYQLPIKEHGCF
jgi:hypothetical protein